MGFTFHFRGLLYWLLFEIKMSFKSYAIAVIATVIFATIKKNATITIILKTIAIIKVVAIGL